MKTSSNTSRAAIITLTLCVVAWRTSAQESFINLDFEAPILPLIEDGLGRVPITQSLPGWRGYLGEVEVPWTFYDDVSIGSAAISLHDSSSALLPIQGNYSVILQHSSGGPPTSSAIGQIGQIPFTSRSLIFFGFSLMEVTFDGQPLSLITFGSATKYQILGVDVSPYAGQTGELRFTLPYVRLGPMAYLDYIQFSPQPVPEPSRSVLLGFGGLMLGITRWRSFCKK